MTPASSAPPTVTELAALSAAAETAAGLLKMLGSEQRLLMLCRLMDGEMSVGDLAATVGLTQSAASQHLGKLRAVGIVGARRDAQNIYYRLTDPAARQVIAVLCKVYGPAG